MTIVTGLILIELEGGRSMTIAGLICVVVAVAIFMWSRTRSVAYKKFQNEIDIDELNQSFADFDRPIPELEIDNNYGFPSFTLKFRSEDDLKAAESGGFMDEFRRRIGERYKDRGTDQKPFSADMAIHRTWEGEFDYLNDTNTTETPEEPREPHTVLSFIFIGIPKSIFGVIAVLIGIAIPIFLIVLAIEDPSRIKYTPLQMVWCLIVGLGLPILMIYYGYKLLRHSLRYRR